jgi:hypothetical protein
MKSSTSYKISRLFYNQNKELDDVFWRSVDDIFGDNIDEMVASIDIFLDKLSKQSMHEVPGNIWFQLADIGNQARRTKSLSQKQIRYVTMSLIAYWDQTDMEFL